MSAPMQHRMLLTPLRLVLIPLAVAIAGTTLTISDVLQASEENATSTNEKDEVALALAHGRVAGRLYMAYSMVLASTVDASLERSTRTTIEEVASVVLTERDRVHHLLVSNDEGDLNRSARLMFDRLDAMTTTATASARLDDLYDFVALAPTLTTEAGRAVLDAATWTNLAPADAVIDRAAAQVLIDGTSEIFPELRDAVEDTKVGSAGRLPTETSEFLHDADQVDDVLPALTPAIEFELSELDTLRSSAAWSAAFDAGGPMQPLEVTLSDVATAALALSHRFDRLIVGQVEHRLDESGRSTSAARDRAWTTGTIGVIVALVAGTVALVAARRRRRDLVQLHDQAGTDELTGLPNQRAFSSVFDRQISSPNRLAHAYFHIDADEFGTINHVHGRSTGDEVLREFARRLTAVVEKWNHELPGIEVRAHAVRLAGDEFAVAVHGVDLGAISTASMSEALRVGIAGTVSTTEPAINLTVSVGGSSAAVQSDIAGMTRRAELALYDAKRLGRSRAIVRAHRSDGKTDHNSTFVLDPFIAGDLDSFSPFIRELVILAELHAIGVKATTQYDDLDAHLTSLGVRIMARPGKPFDAPPPPRIVMRQAPWPNLERRGSDAGRVDGNPDA